MNEPHVYITILNYKKWEDTVECIHSVLNSTYTSFSIIVIDNNSQNNSITEIENWFNKKYHGALTCRVLRKAELGQVASVATRLTLVQNDVNVGFGGGINTVLQYLKNENSYIWLLNPDMVADPNALTELVACATESSPDTIIGSAIKFYSNRNKLFFYGGGKINPATATISNIRDTKESDKLDYISGGCLFTHASNFKRHGLLPEEYFLYWEETDWCYQAKQKSARLIVCTKAVCYDKVSTIIGKGFFAHYYYTRNGLLFVSRFFKINKPIIFISLLLRIIKRIVLFRWGSARGVYEGARDFFNKKFYVRQ
jgi:GT2 family glycosyltransferase